MTRLEELKAVLKSAEADADAADAAYAAAWDDADAAYAAEADADAADAAYAAAWDDADDADDAYAVAYKAYQAELNKQENTHD